MQKTAKKLLALLLAAVMVLGLLAGCGNNSDADSTETTGAVVSDPVAVGMLVLVTDAAVKISYDADALVLSVDSLNDNGVVLSDLYTDYLGKSVTTVVDELIRLGEKQDFLTDSVKNVVIKSAMGSSLPGTSFLDNVTLTVQTALSELNSTATVTTIGADGLTADGYISLEIAQQLLANQLGVTGFEAYYGTDSISNDCYICTVELDKSGAQSSYTINAVTGLISEATEDELLGDVDGDIVEDEYDYGAEEEEFPYDEGYDIGSEETSAGNSSTEETSGQD